VSRGEGVGPITTTLLREAPVGKLSAVARRDLIALQDEIAETADIRVPGGRVRRGAAQLAGPGRRPRPDVDSVGVAVEYLMALDVLTMDVVDTSMVRG
jgi:hypothetical protein